MTTQPTTMTKDATAAVPGALQRVVWHFGWQKTGTPSIQLLMRRNQSALSDRVQVYPKTTMSQPIRRALKTHFATGTPSLQEIEELTEDMMIEVAAEGGPVALISDENLMGWRHHDKNLCFVGYAKTVLPILARAAAPATSQFVFYTREMNGWLKNVHNQEVKNMRQTVDYDPWLDQAPRYADWDAVHAELSEATGLDIVFRDMGQDKADGLPLGGAILEACGIDRSVIAGFAAAPTSNNSLPESATQLMLAMNRSNLPDRAVRQARKIIEANRHLFKQSSD